MSDQGVRVRKKKKNYKFLIPLVIFALAFALYYFIPDEAKAPQNPQELSIQYVNTSALNTPTNLGNASPTIQKAIQAYQREDYASTIIALQNLPEAEHNENTLLMKGYAELKSQAYSSAQKTFEKMISNTQMGSKDKAIWYLALSYLGQNNKEKAIQLFKQQNHYPSESRELVRILENQPSLKMN